MHGSQRVPRGSYVYHTYATSCVTQHTVTLLHAHMSHCTLTHRLADTLHTMRTHDTPAHCTLWHRHACGSLLVRGRQRQAAPSHPATQLHSMTHTLCPRFKPPIPPQFPNPGYVCERDCVGRTSVTPPYAPQTRTSLLGQCVHAICTVQQVYMQLYRCNNQV